MPSIEIGADLAEMDAAVEALPDAPAVFALWPRAGSPYLSRTALLRRRLRRLLGARAQPSRLLHLRGAVERLEYWLTGSAFESSVVLYERARRLFPETYLEALRLRMPPYLKIVLSNPFPRSYVTSQLTGPGPYLGPFRTRASAERFEAHFLDLFQMRRCREDLVPSPAHPGCVYGEMGMCLRPCQGVVSPAEYGQEVARVVEFLETGGRAAAQALAQSRDRLSEELRFEEAARQHKRYEKVQEAVQLRDELACAVHRLHGVAITRSAAPDAVELWSFRAGTWQEPRRFSFEVRQGKPLSLDRQLRETLEKAAPRPLTARERGEYLALLARWYYSSWRAGEWVSFENWDEIPYRKLVNAVSRVAHARDGVPPGSPIPGNASLTTRSPAA